MQRSVQPGALRRHANPELQGIVSTGLIVAQELLSRIFADLEDLGVSRELPARGPLAIARQEAALRRLSEATRVLERLDRLRGRSIPEALSGPAGDAETLSEALGHRPEALLVLRQLESLDEEGLVALGRQIRWPAGFACPHCGGREGTWIRRSRAYRCRDCGRFTALFAGTLTSRSHVPLKAWIRTCLALAVLGEFPAARLARYLSINRTATVRQLVRKIRPLCASIRARNVRLTLHGMLEVLLQPQVEHQPPLHAAH